MSSYRPQGSSDSRVFASYPMPAKIDLLNERPRRESLVEQELANKIGNLAPPPQIQVSTEGQFETATNFMNQARPRSQQSERNQTMNQYHQRIVTNMAPVNQSHNPAAAAHYNYNQHQQHQQKMVQHQQQQQPQVIRYQHQYNYNQSIPNQQQLSSSSITTTAVNKSSEFEQDPRPRVLSHSAQLANELAEKEAKLMNEITLLQQRPYSPYQVPNKIDLTSEQRSIQQQYQNAPSPRPNSRASSTRSTSVVADLLEKEAKLMQEIEEIEKKPYNPQTILIEREQWFEYPEGRQEDRQLTDSKRRVRNFCSLPPNLYPDGGSKHFHEENLLASSSTRKSASPSTIHTTIIRSPKREIDNRSPLPIAFDNFSTKGVRGNIASIGAIEPERPRPPIYPIIKRTPSPSV